MGRASTTTPVETAKGGAPDAVWRISRLVRQSNRRLVGGLSHSGYFPSTIRTRVEKIAKPAGRPQTRVVVAPKAPSYEFSPWEAPELARRRDVYTACTQGFALLKGDFGRGKSQPVPGRPKSRYHLYFRKDARTAKESGSCHRFSIFLWWSHLLGISMEEGRVGKQTRARGQCGCVGQTFECGG